MNSEDILQYKESGMFWISMGMLIFYMGSYPFMVYGIL